jgi:ABC-type nickel/cobalt efflux system permease component RcnA
MRRLAVALVALAAVACALALLSALWVSAAPAPAPRNPFGTGLREAAPSPGGFGARILALQAEFYRGLTGALEALRRDGSAFWSLVALGFGYGVFHAAGPGHGKAVISGYLIATKRTLAKGLGLSFAAAILQAAVAVTVVLVLSVALRATAASVNATVTFIEVASFAALALVGLALLWRKTGALVPSAAERRPASHHDDAHGHGHHHHDHHGACCGHAHAPPAATVERLSTWRDSAAIVLAAGARPCSGAIILLVFAASQGLLAAGVAATFAMALGTALTTGALAALAVVARGAAERLAKGRGQGGARAITALEVLASAFVAVLGGALLLGLWTGAGGS